MFDLKAPTGGKFEFRIEGEETVYSIPKAKNLPASVAFDLSEAAKSGEGIQATRIFLDLLDSNCPGLTETLTIEQLIALVEAWQSEVTLGESQA